MRIEAKSDPRLVRDGRGPLAEPFRIGSVQVANRVLLAPLAGIGNWFVRLQARRHGAGLAVSEMVSSFGVVRGNERTHAEMLRIHPGEHPVSMQLFGNDPAVMREAAAAVVAAGADVIDINMGCPVPKVRRAGSGVALLRDPGHALAVARAAVEGAAGAPVTVKLRSGLEEGDESGLQTAMLLASEAGISAIAFHPRHARVHHKGRADHELTRRLVDAVRVPVIASGGLRTAAEARRVYERTGAAAVMIARGALGNPWIFEELLGRRSEPAERPEVVAEWLWVVDRAAVHLGDRRAVGYLRKFHPWYLARLGASRREAAAFNDLATLDGVRERVRALGACPLPSAA